MTQNFNCPSCGAPLHTDGSEANLNCEYCGASVIVPPELRAQAAPAAAPSSASGPAAPAFPAGGMGAASPAQRRAQLRQMMQLVREGRVDEAAGLLSQATGTPPDSARQTIESIMQSLTGSGRINPAALMSILGQAAPSAGYWEAYNPGQVVQPVYQPVRTRRRGGGLGCLFLLVLAGLGIYASQNPVHFINQAVGIMNTILHQILK